MSAPSLPADRLFDLLPAIYRQRDIERAPAGTDVGPLRALLRVIGEEVARLDENIAQLYENWFIETCEDWVVPYIGDLVGFVPPALGPGTGSPSPAELLHERILIPRLAVAKTVNERRRRGTVAVLQDLARDGAAWPATTVEFFRRLGWTQHLDHQHPERGRLVDLRDGDLLDSIGGPFDGLAHTVDIRGVGRARAADAPTPARALPTGRYAVPLVGLFVWRLGVYSVTRTAAYCQEGLGSQHFSFSVLGNDTQLFNATDARRAADAVRPAGAPAREIDLPTAIRRRAFQDRLTLADGTTRAVASDVYYGEGKSLTIWAPGWPKRDSPQPIPRESIVPADLSDWKYRTPRNFVAVDPVLGRLTFPARQAPKNGVSVTYRYGFAASIGGGEYARTVSQPADARVLTVGQGGDHATINAALAAWAKLDPKPRAAVVEIVDSGVYTEQLAVSLASKEVLQIRAAARRRPVLRLLDYQSDRPDAFRISGGAGSSVVIDGLLVTGRGLRIYGPDPANPEEVPGEDLCEVIVRHCTLVPGWGIDCDCDPREPNEPSIEVINTRADLRIEHSVVGSIEIAANEVLGDPIRVFVSDSIFDATRDDRAALASDGNGTAFALLDIRRSTIFGEIHTHAVALAENCLFSGLVRVARRQIGCLRFCYVPDGSRTPRRQHCQPDLVEQGAAPGDEGHEAARVQPHFQSVRYGNPNYARLDDATAAEITAGASDGGELGAFHDLFAGQRAANLEVRLNEFVPAGDDAEVVFSS
jgi:hypothetical protein